MWKCVLPFIHAPQLCFAALLYNLLSEPNDEPACPPTCLVVLLLCPLWPVLTVPHGDTVHGGSDQDTVVGYFVHFDSLIQNSVSGFKWQ